MSISEKITVAPKADVSLLDNRFALRRKMSSTALVDVYWADDLYTPTQGKQDHLVLLILVAPAISAIPDFAKAWSAIMSRPAPPAASYPNILDWGNEGTTYWFSCANTQGTLLGEHFNQLDKRGLAPEQALHITENVSHALGNVHAGAFGYFEPDSTLRMDHSYVLLNAPIAKVMHSLLLQQTGIRSPLALHSPWLSPSVAVGDLPVTEDDSFSMASLYQMLLGLQPPYGEQSTLTALARSTPVATSPKLKAEAQQFLSQALSLHRNQRPENPDALFKGLKRKNHRKFLLPIATLAAAGVVVYASYHLISKFNGLLNEPNPIAQTATAPTISTPVTDPVLDKQDSPTPPIEAVTLVNEATPKPIEPVAVETPPTTNDTSVVNTATATVETAPTVTPTETTTETTALDVTEGQLTDSIPRQTHPVTENTKAVTDTITSDNEHPPVATSAEATATAIATPSTHLTEQETSTTTPEQQAEVTQLILKATDAFNAGNSTGTTDTLGLLRQVWRIDRQDPNARALLNKVIAQQQEQTESHINLNKPDEAKASLAQTDDLIREFTLTDRIEEQVRLESMIEIREREQREAGDLLQQAKAAVKRGDLSKEEGANNAVAHLNKLMFILPDHPEARSLLADVVQTRQEQINRNLDRNRLSQAETYLDETSRLIRKYNLTSLTSTQSSLERRYRQALESSSSQALQETTKVVITQPASVEQATIMIPPPAEGERYVTPVDDLSDLNPVAPEFEQPAVTEASPKQNPAPTIRTQAPRQPRVQPAPEVMVEQHRSVPPQRAEEVIPEQIQQAPAQRGTPEQNQPVFVEQVEQQAVQLEELPVESVIQVPQAIATDTINNQGVLDVKNDVQGLAAPPTEAEIPDSERK